MKREQNKHKIIFKRHNKSRKNKRKTRQKKVLENTRFYFVYLSLLVYLCFECGESAYRYSNLFSVQCICIVPGFANTVLTINLC